MKQKPQAPEEIAELIAKKFSHEESRLAFIEGFSLASTNPVPVAGEFDVEAMAEEYCRKKWREERKCWRGEQWAESREDYKAAISDYAAWRDARDREVVEEVRGVLHDAKHSLKYPEEKDWAKGSIALIEALLQKLGGERG